MGRHAAAGPGEGAPSEPRASDFAAAVCDALDQLYDTVALQAHPLARWLPASAAASGGRVGQALQRELTAAIDAVGAAGPTGVVAPALELRHRALTLRYVEGLDVDAVARRLGVSRSVYFRAHRRGRAAVVASLRERWGVADDRTGSPAAERTDGTPPLLPPAPRQPSLPRHNLPAQLTSFVGRALEVSEVVRLLGEARLLTLTGSGGCGKTRLVLKVADNLLTAYPGGVWLVELAPVADPTLVPQTVATALAVHEVPGQPLLTALAHHLQTKRALLLLDNCEHVLDATARLTESLLQSCPGLRVLATSREALGIAGEVAWRVPSLTGPARDQPPVPKQVIASDATRLFVERARAADPGFALTPENAPTVAQICWRLDGIPLALELAAARVRGMTIERVAARLDDAFRLLSGGSRTALPRQQTLRATIDWSYALLSDPERVLFRRLAVFAGGCTPEAAEAIGAGAGIAAGDVLDLLSQLVDKSLLDLDREGGAEWYRLLETVRQYARERLVASGEEAAIRDRHRDWYATFTEEATKGILGPQQGAWFHRLDREYANVRAALGWAIEQAAAPVALRLGPALTNYWQARGYYAEGREWLARALALPVGGPSPTPREVSVNRARALAHAGIVHSWLGDPASARVLYEESMDLARSIGDRAGAAFALTRRGLQSAGGGEQQAALAQFGEALALRRELGEPWDLALVLQEYGSAILFILDDAARARPILAESVACYRQAGDRWSSAWPLGFLGWADVELGAHERARAELAESLAIVREVGDKTFLPVLFEYFAGLAAAEGKAARALRLVGAMEALRARFGLAPWQWSSSRAISSWLEAARRALAGAAQAAEEEGRAMALEQAVAHALEVDGG
jgi:predicted ATPase